MAEYELVAELNVGGGFDSPYNARKYVKELLEAAIKDFPSKGEVKVKIVNTSGRAPVDV